MNLFKKMNHEKLTGLKKVENIREDLIYQRKIEQEYKVIKNVQLSAKNSKYVLEWIPYDKFKDVKYVAKGGFGTVYSAYWLDGHILGWDKQLGQWKRCGTELVALKRLHNSQFITIEFLDQV